MKKIIFTLAFILFTTTHSFAHYLWIETNTNGIDGKAHEVKIYFGEYTYGVIEKVNGEAFSKVKDFTLWVIDSNGKKSVLQVIPKDDHYLAIFTPNYNGTYTVLLNNNNIDVIDYTQYDFGIFKTHYHAVSTVQVGNKTNVSVTENENGITVQDISENKDEVKLQVLFKGEPLAKNELTIFISDLWSKTLTTNEGGFVSFKLPWDAKYIVEATKKEVVPGTFNGKNYEFIWHCVTYYIQK